MSSKPVLEPVTPALLPAFAAFLHQHLDASRSVDDWVRGFQQPWMAEPPNHGFVVRVDGEIVGGIGALYAEREIDGQPVRTCNITSWCVLDAYRQQSMRLAMAVCQQPGYHFSDFSPTKVVAGTLQFLKFKALPDGQWVMPNLPWVGGGRVLHRHEAIVQALAGQPARARDYAMHRGFAWLQHLLVGSAEGGWCHVVYKRGTFKGLPTAVLLHASDRALLQRHWRRLSAHFLARGLAWAKVDKRLMAEAPQPAYLRTGFNPKLYLSPSLREDQVDLLYAEQMALDL